MTSTTDYRRTVTTQADLIEALTLRLDLAPDRKDRP